jgi:hypothetical protein
MVEPVFGQIKTNRRIGRLKRRGRAAARSEWRLLAATHNLLKLHRHTLATAIARAGAERPPAVPRPRSTTAASTRPGRDLRDTLTRKH